MRRGACTSLVALACGLLPLLAACDGRFAEQELRWRQDAEADTLEVLFLYEGVETPVRSPAKLAEVADALGAMADRRRFFLFDTWPFDFDLDGWLAEGDVPAEWLPLIESVSLREHGLYVDADGRLAGHQRFRLDGLAAAVELANRVVRDALVAMAEAGTLEEELDDLALDARTRELWVAAARSGATWLAIEGGVIELRVPASRADLLRWAQGVLNEAVLNPEADPVERQLLQLVSAVRFEDELAVLHVGRPGLAVQSFRVDHGRTEPWDPRLLAIARERGWPLDEELTADRLRARFDGD